jgi:L-lactate dehydrogenase complex protein LldF
MMRVWRERDFAQGNPPFKERLALKIWAFAVKRPRLYHWLTGAAARLLARRGAARGTVRRFPFLKSWTGTRDLPAPQGRTFHASYLRGKRP